MHRLLQTIIIATVAGVACASGTQQNSSPIDSGGLGLSRPSWEKIYGQARWEDSGQVLFRRDNSRYLVWFWDGNAAIIDFKYDDRESTTLDLARDEIRNLIPRDSKLVKRENVNDKTVIEYYTSESLTKRFSIASWRYGSPGDFQVSFSINSGSVVSFAIQLGKPIGSLEQLRTPP